MKFSVEWLRQWVSPELTADEIAHRITMAGLEVDDVEPVAPAFSNVVIAHIESIEQHPDADKLRVCQVNDGATRWQVVCGAPNAAADKKVVLARVGAKLPGDFKIKKAKLRGVESNGMLCSESELGLADQPSPGILLLPDDAPIGVDLRDWLKLDDTIIDVDLTPNRGDCFSIRGIAREVGALERLPVQTPDTTPVEAVSDRTFRVSVNEPKACPKLLSRVVENVDLTRDTPLWMVERLRRGGIRSIDLVVDITNYVMLELGQPMHGYDLDTLSGSLIVRRAHAGETLLLLDGNEQTLREETLVIADEKQALAIAGVMGGEASSVSRNTRNVLLEIAHFDQVAMAGVARSYGLHTDASQRFERGVDTQLPELAMARATRLLMELAGGTPGPVTRTIDESSLPQARKVALSVEQVNRLLGAELTAAEIADILERLGFGLDNVDPGKQGEGQWQVSVPSWRFDVTQPVDLIEEVARVYGYIRLPVGSPSAHLLPVATKEAVLPKALLRDELIDNGYQETINFSFVSPELQAAVLPEQQGPEIANPLSVDLSVMRAGLWPGLVKTLQYNLNRQQNRVRIFEIGLTFEGTTAENVVQTQRIAGLISGPRLPVSWCDSRDKVDFFDLKGDVERLLSIGFDADEWSFEAASHPALHPGQSARILRIREGETVQAGWLGALHPQLRTHLGIKQEAYVFELDLALLQEGNLPHFEHLSRYPEVRRDLALVVEDSLPVADLIKGIQHSAGEWLTDVRLFDVYQGKGVEDGHKSLALGLTWQHPSRTLNDNEIEASVKNVLTSLEADFNAQLRG
ncbi:Phenylalanine--tRNA ligase beta subunit [Halomonadaceae bacterium LMG 33818]|uniref:phenylalanine--tRNA ligase subunit beta n=1 Tax=Cernens ardua TaxID=3402176 RepID=UPI003EDC8375